MKNLFIALSLMAFIACGFLVTSVQTRESVGQTFVKSFTPTPSPTVSNQQTRTTPTGIGSGVGTGMGTGRGSGGGIGTGNGNNNPTNTSPVLNNWCSNRGITRGIQITSKPQASYTDAARRNNVQGTVTVRVTFNANGTIGKVSPVTGLPYGLTQQAINAAKGIKFEPAMRCGKGYATTKLIQYSFSIY